MEDCMLSKAFELQRAARNVVCIVNHASLQEVQTMQGNKAFKNVNAVTMLFQCCWNVIQMLLWSLVSSAYRNIFSAYLSQGSCCCKSSYLKVSLLIMGQCKRGKDSDPKGSREQSPGKRCPGTRTGASSSTGPRERSRSRSRNASPSYEDCEKTLEIRRPWADTEEHKWVTLALDILPHWEKMMDPHDKDGHFVPAKTRKEWSHQGATRLHGDAGNKVY